MRWISIFAAVALIAIQGCKPRSGERSADGKLQGLHKFYFPDGKLYLEVNYRDSLPHGTTKRFFKNGKVAEQAEYWHGAQHGVTKTFYETGAIASITPYEKGKIEGVRKRFRRDGGLLSQVSYHDDQPCAGLVEYFVSGRPIHHNQYPVLNITVIDELKQADRFTLELRLSDDNKSVEFFYGKLDDNQCFNDDIRKIDTSDGVGRLEMVLPDGSFVREHLDLIAKVRTPLGNDYVFTTDYELFVENL